MDKKRVEIALKAITDLASSQTRGGWVQARCPLAPWRHDSGVDNNPSFAVKLEDAPDPFGNCFSCGGHGKLSEWAIEVSALNKQHPSDKAYDFKTVFQMILEAEEDQPLITDKISYEDAMLAGSEEPVEFPDWWVDSFSHAMSQKWSRAYLEQRHVSATMATALDLRADYKQKRVCFPVRDFDGVIRGLHGRAVETDDPMRYRMYQYLGQNNPIVWLGEHWVDLNKPIVVVEGPFDVASVMRVYRNVVSPLFANPSVEKIKRMADAVDWVTFLDRGKAGDLGRARIHKTLPKYAIEHAYPTVGEDPGSMSEQQLRKVLGEFVPLDENTFDNDL